MPQDEREGSCQSGRLSERCDGCVNVIDCLPGLSRDVLNSLSANIAVLDRTGAIIAANKSWQDFAAANEGRDGYGYLGTNYLAVCRRAVAETGDEFAIKAYDGISAVLDGRAACFVLEYPCHAPDEQRWFCMKVKPLSGLCGGVVVAHENITERRQAELNLQVTLAKYRTLFRVFPLGITVSDDAGRIIESNLRAEELLGVSESEQLKRVIGGEEWQIVRTDGTLMPTEEYASVRALKENRLVENVEMGIVKSADEVTWLSVNAAPLPLDGYGVTITYGDITERRQAEIDRQQLVAQLLQAQKMESVGHLAGGIAHDLNNMMTPILGYSEMLLEQLAPDDPKRRAVEMIIKAGLRTSEVVGQLLAYSRKQPISIRPLDLNATVSGFMNLLNRTIRDDIAMVFEPSPQEVFIRGDAVMLEQVLMNMAINAQDAMALGGRIVIATALRNFDVAGACAPEGLLPGVYVELSVSDTGSGMNEQVRSQIFEPFFSTKKPGKNSGLGLAMVYGIIKQHGGTIEVESAPGAGTSFHIYLPQASGQLACGDAITPAEAKTLAGNETILLVEDDEMVNGMIEAILRSQGYRVLSAQNGAMALNLMDQHSSAIDLLITDLIMPEVNGRELFVRITEKYARMKVIFISGYPDVMLKDNSLECYHFIRKPFSVNELAARVREVLDGPALIQ